MPSASGSQAYIALIKQDPLTPREIPATPVMQKVNFVDDDLSTNITTKTSEHIRPDRMTTDVTITGYTVAGGYNFEFQYENSLDDELLQAFLWSDADWAAGGTLDETIKNGVTYQPFFVERGHTDANQYFKFVGMACNTLSLAFADQADVTGTYGFVGLTSQLDQAIETGATYAEQTTNPVFSTVTNVAEITIDGGVLDDCFVKEMTLDINNNVTPKTGIGILGACETKAHRLSITGSISMYFEDEQMYTRLLSGTAFSITWTLTDGLGNSYKFILPKVKLDADAINVTGEADEVMDEATYVALYDDVSGSMIQIERTTPIP